MGEATPDFKNIIEQIKVEASPDRRIAAEDDDLLESSEKIVLKTMIRNIQDEISCTLIC